MNGTAKHSNSKTYKLFSLPSSNMKTLNELMNAVNTNMVEPVKKHAGKAAIIGTAGAIGVLGSGCLATAILWEEARNPTRRTVVVTRYVEEAPKEKILKYDGIIEPFLAPAYINPDLNQDGVVTPDEVKKIEQYEYSAKKIGEKCYINCWIPIENAGTKAIGELIDSKTDDVCLIFSKTAKENKSLVPRSLVFTKDIEDKGKVKYHFNIMNGDKTQKISYVQNYGK